MCKAIFCQQEQWMFMGLKCLRLCSIVRKYVLCYAVLRLMLRVCVFMFFVFCLGLCLRGCLTLLRLFLRLTCQLSRPHNHVDSQVDAGLLLGRMFELQGCV